MNIRKQNILITGTPICRGIAIGRPFLIKIKESIIAEISLPFNEVEQEICRYKEAVIKGRREIEVLQKKLETEQINEGAAILETHLQMMQDPLLTIQVEERIRNTSKNAEFAFHTFIKECQVKFDSVSDPFFQDRYHEIQNIYRRVLKHLQSDEPNSYSKIPEDSIILAHDITALDTAEANSDCVTAFITNTGGATSHAAIVAKAKGIPYVSNIDLSQFNKVQNSCVIVDGRTGEIIINPDSETLLKYQKLRDQLNNHLQKITQKGTLSSETYDGYTLELSANIEILSELDKLHQYGGSGVGLFRTESAFISRESLPTEEEQFTTYRDFIENMKGLPVVIRTFDFGGDKYLVNQKNYQESNPFLGCRAIRFSLMEKKVFRTQLKAILRASAYGNIRIMFPMISALSELLEAKAILQNVREELIKDNIAVAEFIPIGCMIEVPSAAIISDLLANECDFLSIGTNDLVQYTLAVDRSNNTLNHLYNPTHPSILRLIKLVVTEANHKGIPVTVCGEIAADPRFTPLLLGLGVNELSVACRYLPVIKNAIRNTSIVAAIKLAEKALTLTSPEEIEELITKEYKKNVPEDCFYNC